MKPGLTTAVIWFVLLWMLFIFAAPLSQILFFLFLPLPIIVLLAGGVIAIIAAVTIRRDYRRGGAVLAICLTGFTLFFSNAGFEWGRYVLFQIRKPAYVQQLAEAERLGRVSEENGHTDDGPPVYHGLYWQRGILDNWSVVVYDPSGRIAEINDADEMDEIHAHPLSDLFGGTYHSCQDVGGGWYICWFT